MTHMELHASRRSSMNNLTHMELYSPRRSLTEIDTYGVVYAALCSPMKIRHICVNPPRTRRLIAGNSFKNGNQIVKKEKLQSRELDRRVCAFQNLNLLIFIDKHNQARNDGIVFVVSVGSLLKHAGKFVDALNHRFDFTVDSLCGVK